jgi:hypothetical protein
MLFFFKHLLCRCITQSEVCMSTNRLPKKSTVCVFYNILNMTIINSWIIYRRINGSDISRRNFIIKIIEEIFDHVSERRSKIMASPLQKLSINTPSPSTKRKSQFQPFASSAKRLFNDNNEQTRAACQIRLCNNNKTAEKCSKCSRRCCGSCQSQIICKNCTE